MPRVGIRRRPSAIQRTALEAFSEDNFDNGIMRVGVIDPSITYPDGTPLSLVAQVNEFGGGNVPERPALRSAILKAAPILAELGQQQAKEMLRGRLRFDVAVRRQARFLKQLMQESILEFSEPPNAESTVAKKGFNDPLVETGLYVDSIDFELLRTRRDQL